MHRSIRALIVDDEALGRERVVALLARAADVVLVGECADGLEALGAISSLDPDLVFLDVHMPELDGLGVVEALAAEDAPRPQIVFVTVHDAYMERAFAVHALDYLRKPFTDDRFFDALEHARRRIAERRGLEASRAGLVSLLEAVRRRAGAPDRVAIREPGATTHRLIPTADINRIVAENRMVRVHFGEESLRWKRTLARMERTLDPTMFKRVSRSTIVNTTRIVAVEPLWKGEFVITMRNGVKVTTGREYEGVIQRLLEAPED